MIRALFVSAAEAGGEAWDELSPFFDYPPEIRKVIDTTHAIESLNSSLRSDDGELPIQGPRDRKGDFSLCAMENSPCAI